MNALKAKPRHAFAALSREGYGLVIAQEGVGLAAPAVKAQEGVGFAAPKALVSG